MASKTTTAKAPMKAPNAAMEGMVKIFGGGEMIAQRELGKAERIYLAALSREATHWPAEKRRVVIELPNAAAT
jgi:hypothetical protein